MECGYECQDIGKVQPGSLVVVHCFYSNSMDISGATPIWTHFSDGDWGNFMSLERPSPSEVVMDEPVEVNRCFQSYPCREGILRMNFKATSEKTVMRASSWKTARRNWRHRADTFCDYECYFDATLRSMELKRLNPSEVVMDKPSQVHQGLPTLSWLEAIKDTFTKTQRRPTFPCSADVQGIANHSKLISGVYRNDQAHGKVTFQMEDCAFNGKGNRWLKEVKFRIQKSHLAPRNNPRNPWMDLHELYPNAEVEMKRNIVKVTIDSPQENHEFAVFGFPDVNDRKRMQVGLFGEKPLQGEDWKIWVILFDDTMMAFQHVCKMEEGRGRELLTTLAGLFVFNSGEDIKINVMDVELGWKIKDGNEKVIKSNDAWNSPENSADFPCCHFEVSQVDQGKKTFTCGVIVSHKQDSAEVEVTAVFEEPKKDREELHLPFAGDIAADDFSDVLVFLQMFAMAMWFINAAVQPAGVLLDPN